MKFSTSKVSITPAGLTHLGGYGARKSKSIGTYSDIYARAILLRDGESLVLFVSLEITGADREYIMRIKKRIVEVSGLKEKDIVVHSVHTHSAPAAYIESRFPYTFSKVHLLQDRMSKDESIYEKYKPYVETILKRMQEGYFNGGVGFQVGIMELSSKVRVIALEGEVCQGIGTDIKKLYGSGYTTDHRKVGMAVVEAMFFSGFPMYPIIEQGVTFPTWNVEGIALYHTAYPNTYGRRKIV